jgi:hypothetical protein
MKKILFLALFLSLGVMAFSQSTIKIEKVILKDAPGASLQLEVHNTNKEAVELVLFVDMPGQVTFTLQPHDRATIYVDDDHPLVYFTVRVPKKIGGQQTYNWMEYGGRILLTR